MCAYVWVCVCVCGYELRNEESSSFFHSAIVTVEFPTTTTYDNNTKMCFVRIYHNIIYRYAITIGVGQYEWFPTHDGDYVLYVYDDRDNAHEKRPPMAVG